MMPFVNHRHVPFSDVSAMTSTTTAAFAAPPNNSSTRGRSNFQQTMSSFADQVNNLPANLSNAVTGVLHQALGDENARPRPKVLE